MMLGWNYIIKNIALPKNTLPNQISKKKTKFQINLKISITI